MKVCDFLHYIFSWQLLDSSSFDINIFFKTFLKVLLFKKTVQKHFRDRYLSCIKILKILHNFQI